MDDVIKELSEAYELLCTILVSQGGVDAMYIAKTKIRNAYKMLSDTEKK